MSSATTVTDNGSPAEARSAPRPHLFVAMCCSAPLEPPSRHALAEVDEVRVGRGSTPSAVRSKELGRRVLTLALADDHASSAHARIQRQDGGWSLEDLGSKNGTFVHSVRREAAALRDGDVLQIGQTLLIFRAGLPTPRQAAADLVATARVPALATLLPLLGGELDLLATVASRDVPIMLLSETGTGKEVLAQAVHALSRRKGPFVPVNCAGLPSTLAESLLFGHKRGAFSGAMADHPGLLRSAADGTLLLDEVGDMPPGLQSALLRVVQDGQVLPVGATQPVHVDIRIVSATHHDLEHRVAEGAFREDLLARLSGFTFRMPPLRERREDIGLLVGVLLRQLGAQAGPSTALSPNVGMALLRHDWPRNVRELAKSLAHAIALAAGRRIELDHLPSTVHGGPAPRATPSSEDLQARLVRLLTDKHGNIAAVAAAMHTSRSQVHRWMKRYGLGADAFRR